jgi:hypothetical protein
VLIAIAALFLVPLGIAFWLYYGGGWRPAGSTQRGDLIDPARPLPKVSLRDVAGFATPPDLLHHAWTMLCIGDGRCDERCRRALYVMRQSRIALNKDASRVQRVLLVTRNCCDREFLAREHPDLVIATLAGTGSAALLAQFPAYDGIPATEAARIYLVDPLGNLMMSYSARAPDKALLEDLRKLLRLSHIG